VSSDSTDDDVNTIVESNILAMSRKSFEFSCAEYSLMVVLIESYSSEPPEFLAMIQQMVSSASFFIGRLEFTLSPVYHYLSSMCIILSITYLLVSHH